MVEYQGGADARRVIGAGPDSRVIAQPPEHLPGACKLRARLEKPRSATCWPCPAITTCLSAPGALSAPVS